MHCWAEFGPARSWSFTVHGSYSSDLYSYFFYTDVKKHNASSNIRIRSAAVGNTDARLSLRPSRPSQLTPPPPSVLSLARPYRTKEEGRGRSYGHRGRYLAGAAARATTLRRKETALLAAAAAAAAANAAAAAAAEELRGTTFDRWSDPIVTEVCGRPNDREMGVAEVRESRQAKTTPV